MQLRTTESLEIYPQGVLLRKHMNWVSSFHLAWGMTTCKNGRAVEDIFVFLQLG